MASACSSRLRALVNVTRMYMKVSACSTMRVWFSILIVRLVFQVELELLNPVCVWREQAWDGGEYEWQGIRDAQQTYLVL